MSYLYLLLNIGTIAFPLARSFEKKMAYAKKWHALFPGILVGMLVFIPWDVAFTSAEFWGFNPRYLTGVTLVNLPLEEWLFFLTVHFYLRSADILFSQRHSGESENGLVAALVLRCDDRAVLRSLVHLNNL